MRNAKQMIKLIVAANGGSLIKTAKELGATPRQVGNWRFRNWVPGAYRFRFREVAVGHGLKIPESWLDARRDKEKARSRRAEEAHAA